MLPRGETMSSISCSERPADAFPPDSNVCSRMDSVPHICPLPRLVRASDEGICNRHATPDEISRKGNSKADCCHGAALATALGVVIDRLACRAALVLACNCSRAVARGAALAPASSRGGQDRADRGDGPACGRQRLR